MVKVSGGNGFSFGSAIIISDCNNTEGVDQEYTEVKKRFGSYILIRQSLLNHEGRMFDKLELELKDGRKIEVLFDITEFFGKGFEF